MASRRRATAESQAAFHRASNTVAGSFTVVLTAQEAHSINRARETIAAKFLLESRGDGTLPISHRQLEAMDVLCDQLGCADLPNRIRAGEAGAREPFDMAMVQEFAGESSVVQFPSDPREVSLYSTAAIERRMGMKL